MKDSMIYLSVKIYLLETAVKSRKAWHDHDNYIRKCDNQAQAMRAYLESAA
jgi:hypothetical protein